MTRDSQAAGPQRAPAARDDLLSMLLGGLWPNDAGLEALLDRLEAREAVR